jgi:hypothetical protein
LQTLFHFGIAVAGACILVIVGAFVFAIKGCWRWLRLAGGIAVVLGSAATFCRQMSMVSGVIAKIGSCTFHSKSSVHFTSMKLLYLHPLRKIPFHLCGSTRMLYMDHGLLYIFLIHIMKSIKKDCVFFISKPYTSIPFGDGIFPCIGTN